MGLKYSEKLEQADPAALWAAVGAVHDRYDADGKKPGSGHWEWDTTYHRRELIDDVIREFCIATDCDQHLFPFRDDYVAYAWQSYRKAISAARRDIRGNS